jgi:hypothetical protein
VQELSPTFTFILLQASIPTHEFDPIIMFEAAGAPAAIAILLQALGPTHESDPMIIFEAEVPVA